MSTAAADATAANLQTVLLQQIVDRLTSLEARGVGGEPAPAPGMALDRLITVEAMASRADLPVPIPRHTLHTVQQQHADSSSGGASSSSSASTLIPLLDCSNSGTMQRLCEKQRSSKSQGDKPGSLLNEYAPAITTAAILGLVRSLLHDTQAAVDTKTAAAGPAGPDWEETQRMLTALAGLVSWACSIQEGRVSLIDAHASLNREQVQAVALRVFGPTSVFTFPSSANTQVMDSMATALTAQAAKVSAVRILPMPSNGSGSNGGGARPNYRNNRGGSGRGGGGGGAGATDSRPQRFAKSAAGAAAPGGASA